MSISSPHHSLAPRSRPGRPLVGLTPLIDVVFILLVFFMLVSSFADWRSIDLTPPLASEGQSQGVRGAILVEMRADGSVRISGEQMRLDQITGRLQRLLQNAQARRFIVKSEDEVPLQDLVNVLDHLSAAGADDIAFMRPDGRR